MIGVKTKKKKKRTEKNCSNSLRALMQLYSINRSIGKKTNNHEIHLLRYNKIHKRGSCEVNDFPEGQIASCIEQNCCLQR